MQLLEKQETLIFLLLMLIVKMMYFKYKKILKLKLILLMNPWSPWILWILLHVILLLKGDLYGFVTLFKMLINMLPLEELSEKARNLVSSKDML